LNASTEGDVPGVHGVAIRAGEIHVYEFNGTFSHIYDGSIPRNNPNAFQVTRVK
jgi:hypothetical protein